MLRAWLHLQLACLFVVSVACYPRWWPGGVPRRQLEDTVFTSGTKPLDQDGKEVEAHEGCMVKLEDAYLWYGSSNKQQRGGAWSSSQVLLYVSHDLSTWRRKAVVFSTSSIPANASGAVGPYGLARPKVLYNDARRYYVLYFHLLSNLAAAGPSSTTESAPTLGVAVSVDPYGPFTFQGLLGLREKGDSPGTLEPLSSMGSSSMGSSGGGSKRRRGRASKSSSSTSSSKAGSSWLAAGGNGEGEVVAGDLTVAREEGGDAYLVRHVVPPPSSSSSSSGGRKAGPGGGMLVMHRLASDYLSTTEPCTTISRPAAAGTTTAASQGSSSSSRSRRGSRQVLAGSCSGGAPVLFKYQGIWYLMAARQPGWSVNGLLLWAVLDGGSPCSSNWTLLPPPIAQGAPTVPGALDPPAALHSRPAFVHLHHFPDGSQLLLYYGDHWDVEGPGSLANASYVWLPLLEVGPPGSRALQLKVIEQWRLGDYRSSVAQEEVAGGAWSALQRLIEA